MGAKEEEDDDNKTPAITKQEDPWSGGPTSTFNKLLAAGDGGAALEDVGKEIPRRAQRHTAMHRAPK